MKIGTIIRRLGVVALLLLASDCREKAQPQLITYQYKEVTSEQNNEYLDEVIIQVSSNKMDAIRKLAMTRYIDIPSLMESHNLKRSEAQALLEEKNKWMATMVERWGKLVSFCDDCELNEGKTFLTVKVSPIEEKDDAGYWETSVFDFTHKDFELTNPSIYEILEEYHLLNAYQEKEKTMSIQFLHEDATFPMFDFFIHANQIQINEDGLTTVISEGLPITYEIRDIPQYDFMKAPWFASNFEGTEFRSAEGFDNVVVPWEYCIEGKYQEQRTGYWSACSKVSLRIYDMFGSYETNLPESSELSYKVALSGYYVKEGFISKDTILTLLDTATWKAEIPTPFALNTFWIGNGFSGITLYESRKDGTQWEYSLDKTDEEGFYLKTTIMEDEKRLDQSFTYFESKDFEKLYQRLLND